MNPQSDCPGADAVTVAQAAPPAPKPLALRIIGVGGAGGNVVSHMAGTELRDLRLAAVHTSARILDMTRAPEKHLLGADLTHGLGAGGDPSLARAAAERDATLLKNLCQGLDLLFLVTGLGGGTGTGVAPVLARIAKECGALVVAVVTMPFEIEGARRRHHAQHGLEELRAAADTVIAISNQKIFRIVDEKTSVLESLKITNDLLAQGIRGIWQMLTRPSLIHVDFADFCAVLRDRHAESSFAAVEAQGEGRAREVIEQLLASPLLDGGQVLADAEAVLVNLVGGPELSMADVKRVMEEINRRTDSAHLIMGASVAEEMQGRLGLTLVVTRRPGAASPETTPADSTRQVGSITLPHPSAATRNRPGERTAPDEVAPRYEQPPPELVQNNGEPVQTPQIPRSKAAKGSSRPQQTHLPLEIISKGRFEKSHPTVHRGEDLDVPTYIRRGIPLN